MNQPEKNGLPLQSGCNRIFLFFGNFLQTKSIFRTRTIRNHRALMNSVSFALSKAKCKECLFCRPSRRKEESFSYVRCLKLQLQIPAIHMKTDLHFCMLSKKWNFLAESLKFRENLFFLFEIHWFRTDLVCKRFLCFIPSSGHVHRFPRAQSLFAVDQFWGTSHFRAPRPGYQPPHGEKLTRVKKLKPLEDQFPTPSLPLGWICPRLDIASYHEICPAHLPLFLICASEEELTHTTHGSAALRHLSQTTRNWLSAPAENDKWRVYPSRCVPGKWKPGSKSGCQQDRKRFYFQRNIAGW